MASVETFRPPNSHLNQRAGDTKMLAPPTSSRYHAVVRWRRRIISLLCPTAGCIPPRLLTAILCLTFISPLRGCASRRPAHDTIPTSHRLEDQNSAIRATPTPSLDDTLHLLQKNVYDTSNQRQIAKIAF